MSQHNFRHLHTCENINICIREIVFFEIENRKHTGHNTTVEQSRLSLVDEHGSCQGNGDKINDTATSKKENS